MIRQICSQSGGQIGHRVKTAGSFAIRPVEQLASTKRRLPVLSQTRGKFFAAKRSQQFERWFWNRLHVGNLTRDGSRVTYGEMKMMRSANDTVLCNHGTNETLEAHGADETHGTIKIYVWW